MEDKKSIGYMIKRLNNVFEKDMNNSLRRLGITASQSAVLNFLFMSSQEGVKQVEIEKELNLKNPTVTGILKRMEEKGFILIVPSTTDKRCKNVFLTEKAYDIKRRMESERRKIEKRFMVGMTKKEKEQLQKVLERVLYNIEEI